MIDPVTGVEAVGAADPGIVPATEVAPTGEPQPVAVAEPQELDPSDPTLSEREKGLLQAKQAETKKRQELESTFDDRVNQAAANAVQQQMYQNQAAQPVQPAQSQEEQVATWLRAKGIDPDYATPVQMTQVFAEVMQMNNQQTQQQTFMAQANDYSTVVGTRNALGKYVKPDGSVSSFQAALDKDPYLAQTQLNEQSAYAIAKREMELAQATVTNAQANDPAMAANAATQPMAGVAAGGGGMLSADAGVQNMDNNSQEFYDYTERVRNGDFD